MMEGITFDDILLLPGYTDFKRGDVDLSIALHPKIKLLLPVISSPMDTVTEEGMARALGKAGGLGVIHRNLSIEKQASYVKVVKKAGVFVGAAVGVGSDFKDRVEALVKANVDLLIIDSGHGYTRFVLNAVKHVKFRFRNVVVMAGNVATREGAKTLLSAGADILRVGMGPGSICTTRIITGMGVPQITAIAESVKAVRGTKVTVVADGGIRQIGDMAKAIGVGAHAVMLGSLLAGFDESPGKKIRIQDKFFKSYRGMGSITAMKKGSAERYGQSVKKKLIAEGVEGLVAYKGNVSDYLNQVAGSLRSAFYYVGGRTLPEFQKKAQFVRVSTASLIESHPHSIKVTKSGGNYLAFDSGNQ